MFYNESLNNELNTSSTIKSAALVTAEWNMNVPDNVLSLGNYRYRPSDPTSKFYTPINFYDPVDNGKFYTDATYSDITIGSGFDDDNTPLLFKSYNEKERFLFSLEDCLGKFRPRSGINKLRYYQNSFTHYANQDMYLRPRYYMASRDDKFKYWTSYRTETEQSYDESGNLQTNVFTRGISDKLLNGRYYIDDACPYVVYKKSVPANRVVVKMQTHVGDIDLGPFSDSSGTIEDPFYGEQNKRTPINWKIQVLRKDSWTDIADFSQTSIRPDGSPIIGVDGYVEMAYGIIPPDTFKDNFYFLGSVSNDGLIPEGHHELGTAYLVGATENSLGSLYISDGVAFSSYVPEYGWYLSPNEEISISTQYATNLTNPSKFYNSAEAKYVYREFEYIDGIRVVAETMNKLDSTLDLIEMSPRLAVDLTDKTLSFDINKTASDLGVSGLPVSQLIASNGTLDLIDYDLSFSSSNESSIIADYTTQNIQIKFYDRVLADNVWYFVPLKTMYSEGFPEISVADRNVKLSLRDLYFYFESTTAPQLLIQNVSLSYAISMLLDSVGFSNYVFLRTDSDSDPVIPFLFIAPDTSLAQVLQDLAVASQSAMFFDEFNNFIVMSKNYILPSESDRPTDMILWGTKDQEKVGLIRNKLKDGFPQLSNILSVDSKSQSVFNDGVISYTSRYIKKVERYLQARKLDSEKTWVYQPTILWEATGSQSTKPRNGQRTNSSDDLLTAIPLNSKLSADVPYVKNRTVVNNIIDLGDGVYNLEKYAGYFFANGEVIRFDAVEYSIPGLSEIDGGPNVWITSSQEYEKYFAKVSFNGSIYPTGRVRIYSEPYYEVIDGNTMLKNGEVRKHGRAQFGTVAVAHESGVSSDWTKAANVRGCLMDSSFIFSDSANLSTEVVSGRAGIANGWAQASYRNGISKNFAADTYVSENSLKNMSLAEIGTSQASALFITGPSLNTRENTVDMLTYVPKKLNDFYNHFGTRMRIIGSDYLQTGQSQSGVGSSSIYTQTSTDPSKNVSIAASSGGIAVLLDSTTNNGYYFEIAALSEDNLSTYSNSENIQNVFFYKVMRNASDATSDLSRAIPVKLWSGFADIKVDAGNFNRQAKVFAEANPTVYDLSVEYKLVGNSIKFYLYINNRLVAVVTDDSPLDVHDNVALFTRGASKCSFENLFAMSKNYSSGQDISVVTADEVFGNIDLTRQSSLSKYALSGIIQSTYLSGISSEDSPKYNVFYEEFGTIMREVAYYSIRYDKAYPALYARLVPRITSMAGYTVSGFTADAYGAKFLVINNTDAPLPLKDANALTIHGITFTQESQNELRVDQYFNEISDHSKPKINLGTLVSSPLVAEKKYASIKSSRSLYGRSEFSISSPYVQSSDQAYDIMGWMIDKIMKPRLSLGISIFPNPTIQLGDIVQVYFEDENGNSQVTDLSTRFVVYNIEYSRSVDGPSMTVFVSEV